MTRRPATSAAALPSPSFSHPTLARHFGTLSFPGPPDSLRETFGARTGPYKTLLKEGVLHVKDDEGLELARLSLKAGGWTRVSKGKENVDGGYSILLEGDSVQPQSDMPKRKKSSPALSTLLGDSTNVLAQEKERRSWLKLKRKSISTTAAILLPIPIEPITLCAATSNEADQWVHYITLALRASPASNASILPHASSSRPTGLSTLGSSILSVKRRPSTSPASSSFPAAFNPDRRPSFLDRPPPSPNSYVTFAASAPPSASAARRASQGDVPGWIQSVRTAAGDKDEMDCRRSSSSDSTAPARLLKPKRSLSLKRPSDGTSNLTASSSYTPESPSGGKKTLLQLLGVGGGGGASALSLPPHFSAARRSSSSLSESLTSSAPSHSLSSSNSAPSSEYPLTPDMTSRTLSSPNGRHHSSSFSPRDGPSSTFHPLDFSYELQSSSPMGLEEFQETLNHHHRRHQSLSSSYPLDSTTRSFSAQRHASDRFTPCALEPSPSLDPPFEFEKREDPGEHIINPSELLERMQQFDLTSPRAFSGSASSCSSMSPPPRRVGGGLSPPPRRKVVSPRIGKRVQEGEKEQGRERRRIEMAGGGTLGKRGSFGLVMGMGGLDEVGDGGLESSDDVAGAEASEEKVEEEAD